MAGISRTYKHAFDFFYQWVPTGSETVTQYWPTASISGSIPSGTDDGIGLTAGLYNNDLIGIAGLALETAQPTIAPEDYKGGSGLGSTPDEGVIPKGSMAIDFLWNVQSLSSSYVSYSEPLFGGFTRFVREWHYTYNTESFAYHNIGYNPVNKFWDNPPERQFGYGLEKYPVLSNWVTYEPLMYENDFTWSLDNNNIGGGGGLTNPMTIRSSVYSKATDRNRFQPTTAEGFFVTSSQQITPLPPGTNPVDLVYENESTGSNDGRYFSLAGGCGITRASISASLVDWDTWRGNGSATGRANATIALLERRLFFPTIATGSSTVYYQTGSAAIGTEWLPYAGLTNTENLFNENGGIYNVKFTLKRDIANDFYPDTGNESQLLVYIFEVNTTLATAGNFAQPGDNAFYPPENNIVRIKNNPQMSFVNPATGFLLETFNVSIVQYGAPAQLVFEASGSLATENYFGCIVDDVEFCKIGVSTDPSLIKPETIGDAVDPGAAPLPPNVEK